MMTNNPLQLAEPDFYQVWLKSQYPGDPQIERWIQYESDQLARSGQIVANFINYFPVAGKTVLDVGCQWGATSIALARAGGRVTGVDVVPEFIAGARVRAGEQMIDAKFKVSAAEGLPFADDSFDVVYCTNVIEHVANHQQTVRELARVLKPGGMLYLDGPNRFSPANLASDPHYQLRLIAALPNWLGDFYVRRIRRFPAYDVGVFPCATQIERLLKREGLKILLSWKIADAQSGRNSIPAKIRREIRQNLQPIFSFIALK